MAPPRRKSAATTRIATRRIQTTSWVGQAVEELRDVDQRRRPKVLEPSQTGVTARSTGRSRDRSRRRRRAARPSPSPTRATRLARQRGGSPEGVGATPAFPSFARRVIRTRRCVLRRPGSVGLHRARTLAPAGRVFIVGCNTGLLGVRSASARKPGFKGRVWMLAYEWTFGSVLWAMVVFFFWFMFDLDVHRGVRRHLPPQRPISGGAKAGWIMLIVIVPFLGHPDLHDRAAEDDRAGPRR